MPPTPDLNTAAHSAKGDEIVTVSLLEGASLAKQGDSTGAKADLTPGPARAKFWRGRLTTLPTLLTEL